MIEILKYIFIGLVQGFAEVLPISSSAHIIIASEFVDIDNSVAFEVFLHLASLIAVLVFLRKRLWRLIKGFCLYLFKKNKDYKLEFNYCLYIVLSTLFLVVFTLIIGDFFDFVSNTLWIVGLLLCINGFLLFFLTQIKGTRKEEELNYKDSIVIGLFQCLGSFPGISRSGSCLYGAYARKIDNQTAADYAFTLFVPAMVGATVLHITEISSMFTETSMLGYYILSFIVTLVTTYIAFKFLLAIIRKGKLNYFGYYCLAMGAAMFVYGLLK